MREEEEKLSIYLTGAEEDRVFLRAVAAGLESTGHEIAVPTRLEDHPDIISELKERAGLILKEMESPQPIELEAKIFLSFSGQDENIVRTFGHELGRRGVSV
jgi:hypothetical protein